VVRARTVILLLYVRMVQPPVDTESTTCEPLRLSCSSYGLTLWNLPSIFEMAKPLTALFLSTLFASATTASAWGAKQLFKVARPEPVTTPQRFPSVQWKKYHPGSTAVLESVFLRGGGECACCEAACKILSPKNVASAFAGVTLVNGAALALAPEVVMRAYGGDVQKGSLAALYAEFLGFVDIGLALSFFLAGRTSINKVVAYGLIPRLAFFAKNVLTGKFADLGIKMKRFLVPLALGTGFIGILLSGKAVPDVALKIVSAFNVLVGLVFVTSPCALAKIAGIDLKAKGEIMSGLHSLFCMADFRGGKPKQVQEKTLILRLFFYLPLR